MDGQGNINKVGTQGSAGAGIQVDVRLGHAFCESLFFSLFQVTGLTHCFKISLIVKHLYMKYINRFFPPLLSELCSWDLGTIYKKKPKNSTCSSQRNPRRTVSAKGGRRTRSSYSGHQILLMTLRWMGSRHRGR